MSIASPVVSSPASTVCTEPEKSKEMPVSLSGSERFLNALAVLNRHFGYQNSDLRGTLSTEVERLLNIVFAQRAEEPSRATLEKLASCTLEIPFPQIQLSLAAPVFEVAELIPRAAFSSALDAMSEGDFLQDDREAWRAVRYIRRTLKLAVNAIRIFDRNNSAGDLTSVTRKLGRTIDIITYDGDPEEALEQARKVRKKWKAINGLALRSFVHPGSHQTLRAYLDKQLDRIRHVTALGELPLPMEDIHDCRKGLQSFLNLHRLLWIQDGGREAEILPFRILAGISRQLGVIHNSYVEKDVRGILAYEDASAALPEDLKELLRVFYGNMRFT